MAEELIFTSVPKGLKSGSDGYCTVAYTDGMSANAVKFLESISDYSFLSLDDPNLSLSPVSFRHYRHQFGNQVKDIISRVAFFGFDYTKRSNKLAHHILLSSEELPPAGPAWLCTQSESFFVTEWNKEPELRKYHKKIPKGEDNLDSELITWRDMAGDAGWGGKLAETFIADPDKPSYIIYDIKDSNKIIELIREALLLLPPERRWDVTFNTYFTGVRSVDCAWRCCLKDAPVLARARGVRGTLIIDLTSDADLPPAEGGTLVNAAREGKVLHEKQQVREEPIAKEKVLPNSEPESQKIELFGTLKEEMPPDVFEPSQNTKVAEVAEYPSSLSEKDTEKQNQVRDKESDEIVDLPVETRTVGVPNVDKGSAGKYKYVIILGVILLCALGVIIKQQKENLKLQTKIKQIPHQIKSQPATREVVRDSQIQPPKKVEEQVKIVSETVDVDKKAIVDNSPKTATVKKMISSKTTVEEPEKVQKPPANKEIWRQYQKAVRQPGSSTCEIILPRSTPGSPLELIWRKEKKIDLERKGVAPEKTSDGVIVNSIEGAGIGDLTKICKFSVQFSQDHTKLIIDKYRDSASLIDLSNDIEALKIGTELYPLQYGGDHVLPQGKGEVLDLLSGENNKKMKQQNELSSKSSLKSKNDIGIVGTPFLELTYLFSDDDLLAGLNNIDKYGYELRYNDRILPLKPEVSDKTIKYHFLYNINIPELKKIFMEADLILNSDFSENLSKIERGDGDKFTEDVTLAELQEALSIKKREYSTAIKEKYNLILEPLDSLKGYIEEIIKQTKINQNSKKDKCRRVLNDLLSDLKEVESAIKNTPTDEFRKYVADMHIKKVYIGDQKGRGQGRGAASGKLNQFSIPSGFGANIKEIKKQLANLNFLDMKQTLDQELAELQKQNPLAENSAIVKCIGIKKRLNRGPAGVVEMILQREDLRAQYEASLKLIAERFSIIIKRSGDGKKVKTVTF